MGSSSGRYSLILPYTGFIGMCGPKGYGYLGVLVRNKESILAILASNRVWVLHPSLELGMFIRGNSSFIIIDKTINKSPLKCL